MVAGRGWIALALTTFATWRPARVLLGAYLFGGVTMLQFHLQATGVQVASQWLSMLPYLSTILVLALISRNPQWIRVNMPASRPLSAECVCANRSCRFLLGESWGQEKRPL